MQTNSVAVQILLLVLSFVIPPVAAIGMKLLADGVDAFKEKAAALLSAEDRDALYAAVKVGVRVAQSHGITLEGTRHLLETKGAEAASAYLHRLGIEGVTPTYLLDLLNAEHTKGQPQLSAFAPTRATYERVNLSPPGWYGSVENSPTNP